MTLVASRLAAKQLIAQFFLRRELVFFRLHVVVFRREGTHFWRELVCGNGQPELVIDVIGATSVSGTQVERELIIRRWRPWSRANPFRIARPSNGKRVRAPHGLKELAVVSLGKAVRNTRRIGQTHFHGIRRRSLGLFGAWILQAIAARAHIPEIATDKVALERVVVEHGREGGVHVALRLSIAEARSHRSGIRHGRLIQRLNRSGESRLRGMAETACFVLMDREALIEEQQLSQGADLSLAIERGAVHLAESVGLNPIDVGNDPRHIPIEGGRHPATKIVLWICCAWSGSSGSLWLIACRNQEHAEGEKTE